MKSALLIGLVLASAASDQTLARDASESGDRASEFAATTEFSSATGRPLGSVTKIGGTTYYLGADGTMLGTSTVVEGRRIFKTY